MVRISIVSFFLLSLLGCNKIELYTPPLNNSSSKKVQIVCSESAQTPTQFIHIDQPINDSAYTYNPVKITTNIICQKLQWKIANDVRIFTDQAFRLNFTTPGDYPITLITTYYDSLLSKSITDTITKLLTIVDKNTTSLANHILIGNYTGSNTDNSTDTFTISINHYYNSNWDATAVIPYGTLTINNLPKGNKPDLRIMSATSTYLPKAGFPTDSHYSFLNFAIDILPELQGNAYLKNDNKTLIINYSYLDTTNSTRYSKTFIGKKI